MDIIGSAKHQNARDGKGGPGSGFWLAGGRHVLALVFAIAAAMKLAGAEFEVSGFARFGYAPWFMVLIAAAQLAGALMLLTPGWTAPGAAFLALIMLGAAGSHLRAGDPVLMAGPALVLLAALLALAYARREEFRAFVVREGSRFADAGR